MGLKLLGRCRRVAVNGQSIGSQWFYRRADDWRLWVPVAELDDEDDLVS